MPISYKFAKGLYNEAIGVIKLDSDKPEQYIFIPEAADNSDYQEYLAWIAQGNQITEE